MIIENIGKMFVTGDIHGDQDIHKLSTKNWNNVDGSPLEGNNILFQVGDFGLVWEQKETKEERYWLNWLDSKPFYTLFIGGNHENYARLKSYPLVDFHGGKAAQISEKVFYLQNGYVYDFDYTKIWMFGGATSIDKANRIEGVSWWKEEIPEYKEMQFGLDSLEKVNYEVDFIITHTLPKIMVERYLASSLGGNFHEKARLNHVYPCPVTSYLDNVFERVLNKYKKWFCGHYHFDAELHENFQVLYQKIVRIK